MPRLVSSRPGALATWIELSGYWRIAFGVAPWDEVWCLALMAQPAPAPPAPLFRYDLNQVQLVSIDTVYIQSALLRAQVPFAVGAEGYGGMGRVAAAANASQTLEVCIKRTTEALNLFQNMPRIKAGDVQESAVRLESLVKIAWEVKDWMIAGAPARKAWELEESMLVALP